MERTEGANAAVHYGFAGPACVLSATNVVTQRVIGLLDGASITQQSSGDVWSYPNAHGDVIATADGAGAGAKQGSTLTLRPLRHGHRPDNAEGSY